MLFNNPEHPFRVPFTARLRQAIHAFAAARQRRLVARLTAFAMLLKDQNGDIGRYLTGLFRW